MNPSIIQNTLITDTSPNVVATEQHNCQDLVDMFNATFRQSENTILVKGGLEPIYLPASVKHTFHQIIFSHDYFASALHEIAHWCIAGKTRRLVEDYGYWYCPDGRDTEQQAQFEQVEVKPQAIEWAFSSACNKRFVLSADNLSGVTSDNSEFKRAVYAQVRFYLTNDFPPRATQFIKVLQHFYQTPALNKDCFNVFSA